MARGRTDIDYDARPKIAVICLGYVGAPVAVSFARSGVPVVGFDVSNVSPNSGKEKTGPVRLKPRICARIGLLFTADPAEMVNADFFIVTAPTPIDEARNPDLRAMIAASRSVGTVLKRGDIVVYESTVSWRRGRRLHSDS